MALWSLKIDTFPECAVRNKQGVSMTTLSRFFNPVMEMLSGTNMGAFSEKQGAIGNKYESFHGKLSAVGHKKMGFHGE